MDRCQQNHLKRLTSNEFEILRFMCHQAQDLRNLAIETHQHRYESGQGFSSLYVYHSVKTSLPYKYLPTRVGQSVLESVNASFKSFFAIHRKKVQGEYDPDISSPQVRLGTSPITFHDNAIKDTGDTIRLTLGGYITKSFAQRYLHVPKPPNLEHIKRIRIIPRFDHFLIDYIYEISVRASGVHVDELMGIDLGLNNFATCVTNHGTTIIDGRGLKSLNRWFNMRMAMYSRIYAKQGYRTGKRKQDLSRKRHNQIEDFMRKTTFKILSLCVASGIGRIVIGNAPLLLKPQLTEFGDTILTQNFKYIPYLNFLNKLKAKAEIYGIQVDLVEESLTSILCSRCGYADTRNRLRRGWMRCRSCRTEIHADVNAAINIARQVSPQFLKSHGREHYVGSSGSMVLPARIRLSQTSC